MGIGLLLRRLLATNLRLLATYLLLLAAAGLGGADLGKVGWAARAAVRGRLRAAGGDAMAIRVLRWLLATTTTLLLAANLLLIAAAALGDTRGAMPRRFLATAL